MRRYSFLLFSFYLVVSLQAQPIEYALDLSNITHHELKITINFTDLPMDTLELRMPDASPGRYAPHQFAKNVYETQAYDARGESLDLIRATPYSWLLPISDGTVTVEYILYANHGDGTYSGVDSRKLHLNMPATFIYGVGLEKRPVTLKIDLNDHPNWTVATQLEKVTANTFKAPNYYYFYDSPTFVGDIARRSWQVDGQTIEMAVLHEGSDEELDAYAEWVKKVVAAEKQVYGELPAFDFGKYTFLMAYNPWVFGDGMEHRNSTICSSQSSLATNATRLIGTVAHEFFHAWNVERIRPASLEPFDFDKPNMSEALWFAEGFTSYYDDLTLCRAGIITPDDYLKSLASNINYVVNSPGRKIRNPMEMSQNAPFVDAATANDETNYANNFISYYSYGAILGLVLDLSVRSEFKDLTLDDFMQNVWLAHGKTEIPYTMADLQKILIETTDDEAFGRRFFDENIFDSHLPDINELLESFGATLVLENEGMPYFGRTGINRESKLLTAVIKGTAWYEAGVEKGDRIISIAGEPIDNQNDFREITSNLKLGQSYNIEFEQLGRKRTGSFTASQDPTIKVVPSIDVKKKIKKAQDVWLWQNQ